MTEGVMHTKRFGGSHHQVSIVGLGGEGVLRTHGRDRAATEVIESAIAEGITYFDSARAYAGSEGYYGQVWRGRPADRQRVFQASKSAMRGKREALSELEQTLSNMGIEALDLWQIHDVRTRDDIRAIEGPGGALEAFVQAREQGKIRFIGVTGHHDPAVLTLAVRNWPVDAVMMPVNPVEGVLGGFLDQALPAAHEKGLAVIGMKVLGASHYLFPGSGVTPELLIRFALSQPITVAIVGCSTTAHVAALASVGRAPNPLTPEEQEALLDAFRPHAHQLGFYRGERMQ
jgi:aryl-alcohol dehydrogenase-like predicted oxidoreductase